METTVQIETTPAPAMAHDCQHETDPVTGGCITAYGEGFFKVERHCTPVKDKCEHGVYIPESERLTGQSSYCGACNPAAYGDEILRRTMSKKRIVSRIYPEERTIDAAEFLEMTPGQRISGTREFFSQ